MSLTLPVVSLPTASSVACGRCPALVTDRTQIVDGAGPDSPLLLVVGEAPGEHEDLAGIPFVGRSGELLRSSLGALGIENGQIRFTNAVRCRPPGNRNPTQVEIDNCGQWLAWEIEQHKPRVILALGKIAEQATDWDYVGIPRYTAWHPAYVLRSPKQRQNWLRQLGPAVEHALSGQAPSVTTVTPDPWEEVFPVGTANRPGIDYLSPWLALDTETDDLEEGHGVNLVCTQISDGRRAMLLRARPDSDQSWFRHYHWWIHNAKYDAPLVGINLRDLVSWDDTALVAYVLRHERVGLKELGPKLTGLQMTPIRDILTRTETVDEGVFKSGPRKGQPKIKTKKVKQSFSEALVHDRDRATQYALLDPVVTSRVAQVLWPQLQAEPVLMKYYQELEKPAVPILQECEARGVLVDPDKLILLRAEIDQRVGQHEQMARLILQADDGLNLASNDQLADALLSIGFTLTERTATGKLSVAEQPLLRAVNATTEQHIGELLEDQTLGLTRRLHLSLVRDLLKIRELTKLKSTYVEALLNKRDADGRVHGRFNQMVTNTNRLSSSDPNLQNIPARDPLGKTIREAFIAKPGHVIVKADYSQLEVRIYAALSGERVLVESYPSVGPERDVHQSVADALGIPRKRAKNVLFATLYGASAPKLAATAGVPLSDSGSFLARMRQEMPTLLTWQQRQANEMTQKGYIETLLGWRGYFPTFWSPIDRDRNEAMREMANFPIQGTAAGVVKKLMIAADQMNRGLDYGADLILQVHDEVVYEVPAERALTWAKYLEDLGAEIGRHVGLSVPLMLNVEIGPSWGNVTDWRSWSPS